MRKRAKNGRSSVFRFIRWSINKNCSAVNHCLQQQNRVADIYLKCQQHYPLGPQFLMSSVNSAGNTDSGDRNTPQMCEL